LDVFTSVAESDQLAAIGQRDRVAKGTDQSGSLNVSLSLHVRGCL
jgi:hypothetical protein